jgi:plastocyanin
MVLPGTSITWRNDDTIVHSVKATGIFNSGAMVPGASFSFSFGETPGTYHFVDGYYPNVTGTITIQKGAPLFGGDIITAAPAPTTTS